VACVSSQELAEAEDADHVASEAADLLYFAMVRCVAAGVGIAEIESHLDRRSLKLQRRPGNDKKERNAAAEKILREAQSGREEKRQEQRTSAAHIRLPALILLVGLVAVVRSRA
ncbi:MAG: hypothetical protein SGPRY_013525, partial [Prymnesium sp.]